MCHSMYSWIVYYSSDIKSCGDYKYLFVFAIFYLFSAAIAHQYLYFLLSGD